MMIRKTRRLILVLVMGLTAFVGSANAALTLTIDSYTTDEITFSISGTLDATTIGTEPGYMGVKNDWSNNVGVHTEWFSADPSVTSNLLVGGISVTDYGIQNDASNGWNDNFWFANPTGGPTAAIAAGTVISGSVTLSQAGAFNPADEATLQLVSGFSTNQWVRLEALTVPPIPAAPVPTMSEWALVILLMLLGLMVFTNRKRLF